MFDVFDEELAMLEEDLEAADNEFDALEKEIGTLMEIAGIVNEGLRKTIGSTIIRLEQQFEEVQKRQDDLMFRIAAMKV